MTHDRAQNAADEEPLPEDFENTINHAKPRIPGLSQFSASEVWSLLSDSDRVIMRGTRAIGEKVRVLVGAVAKFRTSRRTTNGTV